MVDNNQGGAHRKDDAPGYSPNPYDNYPVEGQDEDQYDYDPPTEVMEPQSPPEDNETRVYSDLDVDDYDFAFEQEVSDNLHYYHPDNIPRGFTSGEWVALSHYGDLYDSYSSATEEYTEIVSGYKKAYDDAFSRNEQLENLNKELSNQAMQASVRERSSNSNLDVRQAQLDNDERELERRKAQDKWLRIGLYAATGILAVLCLILLIMYINANNNADSSNKRDDVRQSRIAELEKSLDEANNSTGDLQKENDDLKGRVETLNKRANDAEGKLDDQNKESKKKDDTIRELNDKVKDLEEKESEPSTVTETATASPSTVTETSRLPGTAGSTVTETVTADPGE